MHVEIVLDSIRYYQKKKGFEAYGWVIMSNPINLLISREEHGNELSAKVKDFEKYNNPFVAGPRAL